MISVKDLLKIYHNNQIIALNNVSFNLDYGINAIIGPNGAGKTTLIKILAGLLNPSKGTVIINGLNIKTNYKEIQEIIGYVGQSVVNNSFQFRLTAKENLLFFGRLRNIKKKKILEEISKYFSIFETKNILDRQFSTLSGGERQILAIIRALIGSPKILFLDEPTNALDPIMAHKVRRNLLNLVKQNNMNIVITSHNMYELDEIANRLIFIKNGKKIYDGKTSNFKKRVEIRKIIQIPNLDSKTINKIKNLSEEICLIEENSIFKIYTPDNLIKSVIDLIPNSLFSEINIINPDLENTYIKFLDTKWSDEN